MVQNGWRMHKLLRKAKCLKTFSDGHEHISNTLSPFQKRLLLTGQDCIKNFLPSRSTTFHTHTSSCFSQPHFSQLQTYSHRIETPFCPSCYHTAYLLQTLFLLIHIPPPFAQVPQTKASNSTPPAQAAEEDILSHPTISHTTVAGILFHIPWHGWLWTWKYKCRYWLNFCIPGGFKWYAVNDLPGGPGSFWIKILSSGICCTDEGAVSWPLLQERHFCLQWATPVPQILILLFGLLVSRQDLHGSWMQFAPSHVIKSCSFAEGLTLIKWLFAAFLTFVYFWILSISCHLPN